MDFNLNKNTLIVILGPTASGKTDAAIRLAKELGTEIISADSRQFYREMRIGTARPDDIQLASVRHHFVGHLSVTDDYNAAGFENDALKVLDELFREHSSAIMVGGSGLYIDAVCNGIDELPDPEPGLRQQLKDEFQERGIEYLQQELLRLDPGYYRVVDLANPKRLLRALEVCIMTGKPYSSLRKHQPKKREFGIVKFGLDIPRDELNARIDHRVDMMMADGLLDEVRSLVEFRNFNALNTVGYKELFGYLDGSWGLEEAVAKIKTNTRRYAKRQMTWFRKDSTINWVRNWEDIRLR